jgi:hypothetical protein
VGHRVGRVMGVPLSNLKFIFKKIIWCFCVQSFKVWKNLKIFPTTIILLQKKIMEASKEFYALPCCLGSLIVFSSEFKNLARRRVMLNINEGEKKSERKKNRRKRERVEWVIAAKTVKINNETTK